MDKLDKEKAIKKEINRLKKIFSKIDEDKKELSERLIKQLAFMSITLFELQETVNTDGAVELFEQGSQRMLREHPAVKSYNSMIKNYNSTIKQLIDLLPKAEQKIVTDGFDMFVNGRHD